MAEWSKAIGERGEDIVTSFLKMVGHIPEKGIDITCNHDEKHQLKKDTPRTQHGLDFLTSYKCPLQKDILENLIISSKFTEAGYKSDPKNEFKKFFVDLAYGIECFKKSSKRNESIQGFSNRGIENCSDTGVLFYLSNKPEDIYTDIISKVSDSSLPDGLNYDKIFLVDNYKLAFIFDAITFANSISNSFQFIYPDTGLNINPAESFLTGTLLPVQFFNSPILPLRLEKSNKEIILYLALNDHFNEINLKRLLGLAQKLNNLSNSTILTFPDYNKLNHSSIVQKVTNSFHDTSFSSKVSIDCFRPNFINQL